jgi:hypothetical protein
VISHLSRRFRGPLLMALAFRQTPARLAGALEEATRAGLGTRGIAELERAEHALSACGARREADAIAREGGKQ